MTINSNSFVKFESFDLNIIENLKQIALDSFSYNIFETIFEDELTAPPGPFVLRPENNAYEINGVEFTVAFLSASPAKKMAKVHTDRIRKLGFNIPLQVDVPKGYTLIYTGNNYSELGNSTNQFAWAIDGFTDFGSRFFDGNFWPDAKEENLTKVFLDQPVIFNTKLPHSFVNYSNKPRILATLTPQKDIDNVNELYEMLLM